MKSDVAKRNTLWQYAREEKNMEKIGRIELAILEEKAAAYDKLMAISDKLPSVKKQLVERIIEIADKRLAMDVLVSINEIEQIFELYKIVSYVIKEEAREQI